MWNNAFYSDLLELCRQEALDIRAKYAGLYRIFLEILKEKTRDCSFDFSGPFARMDYLCKELGYEEADYKRINALRARCRSLHDANEAVLEKTFLQDMKALSEFVSRLYQEEIPEELAACLPDTYRYAVKSASSLGTYLRVLVDSWDDEYIYGKTEAEETEFIQIRYRQTNYFGDWSYLQDLLVKGAQLNLIHPYRVQDDIYLAELMIFEPDYLIDVSAIANCFEAYGCTPLTYLLNKIKPAANSRAILLGNFASQLLDEVVNEKNPDTPVPYADSVKRFFRENALKLVTCPDMDPSFHTDARKQHEILEDMIHEQFNQVCDLHLDRIILEPSFFCEMLGLQGRMDLLQEDMRVLMEQKSGKREYGTNRHVEKHYVQMLLYLALLHYNYNLRNDEISSFLLYSKYKDGLMKEGPAPELLFQAIEVRNRMVKQDLLCSEGGAATLFDGLTPEDLNVRQIDNPLWKRYQQPQLAGLLEPIQQASDLERAYFYRFFTFIEKEHILSKVGTAEKEGSGFATVWNNSLEEKKQTGDIFCDLEILSLENSHEAAEGIDRITLRIPEQENNFLPNFRTGDVVILYAYPKDKEPDARKTIVHRCQIEAIYSDHLVLRLRALQRNQAVFDKPADDRWAVEHDFLESSFGFLFRALYAFLVANADRRSLLLGQRKPVINRSVRLIGDYSMNGECPEFNELVLKAKQARDYFLLIGPPGTGKTSFGLVNILKEALCESDTSVLLVSYTNRAVDEICSKLVKEKIDFIRMGMSLSCDDAYKPYLLERQMETCQNIQEIRKKIQSTRVFVGTTTNLSSNVSIFTLKKFALAIVDEASQILEPHLLALLSAKHGDENAIDRFVLIGDHKQLPAVVLQSETDSAVTDPLLQEIGLTNCRLSLFERLLKYQQEENGLSFCLEKQGRMHPAISSFPNEAFYQMRLRPVPLQHQQQPLSWHEYQPSGLEKLMATQRIGFVVSPQPPLTQSVKTNLPEACMIAKMVETVWHLYQKNGRPFSLEKSIGVIVPYRNQIAMIRHELDRLGLKELHDITIDTVERYQGSEREVIIYGFTIQKRYQLDFLTGNVFEEDGDRIDRKLNVALTRAREQLFLVGNPYLLNLDPLFRHLISYVKQAGIYLDVPYMDFCEDHFIY